MGRQESVEPTAFAAAPGSACEPHPAVAPAQARPQLVDRLPRQVATLGVLLVVPTPPAARVSANATTADMRGGGQMSDIRWRQVWWRAWRDAEPPSPLPNGSYVYPINHHVVTIGRALSNTVTLLDTTVSREHAYLHWRGGAWSIENVAEQNPLWVGDRLIPPGEQAPIQPGDLLRLGNTRLRLLAPQPTPRPPLAQTDDDAQTRPIPTLPATVAPQTLAPADTPDSLGALRASHVSGVYVVAPGASGAARAWRVGPAAGGAVAAWCCVGRGATGGECGRH